MGEKEYIIKHIEYTPYDYPIGVTKCKECGNKFGTGHIQCPYCHPDPEQEAYLEMVRQMVNKGLEP